MSKFCFMRTEKIKSYYTIQEAYDHNARLVYVPNANSELAHLNEVLVPVEEGRMKEIFQKRLMDLPHYKSGGQIRKNAVLAIEVVMSYSREEAEHIDIDKWKEENLKWLSDTFEAKNLLSVVCHADEIGNMHIHAILIHIDNNQRLNASYYFDGAVKLRSLQDSYAKAMLPFGLERGLRHSVAKHEDIKRFYGAINKEITKELPPVQKSGLRIESAEKYRERVNEIYKDANLARLNYEKKLQRKYEEKVTKYKRETIDELIAKNKFDKNLTDRAIKAEKTIDELVKEFGTIETIREKLVEHEAIQKGIDEYMIVHPELKKLIQQLLELLRTIIEWYKKKYYKEVREAYKDMAEKKEVMVR